MAMANVPASRDAIRSIGEASGARQRRFLNNVQGPTRLRASDC